MQYRDVRTKYVPEMNRRTVWISRRKKDESSIGKGRSFTSILGEGCVVGKLLANRDPAWKRNSHFDVTKVPFCVPFRSATNFTASATMKAERRFVEGCFGMSGQAAKRATSSTSPAALFAWNFFKYPTMLGSVVPSSRFLVNDMMRQVDWERARVIVEFGPGVGTFTKEALRRMRRDATLLVIELNGDFVAYLRNTICDSRLLVVHGSAAHVRRILAEQGLIQADCIISGLPFTLLPEELQREIVSESRNALKPHGSLLLFQYSRRLLPCLKSSFSSVRSNFQLFNILPALIFHCTP